MRAAQKRNTIERIYGGAAKVLFLSPQGIVDARNACKITLLSAVSTLHLIQTPRFVSQTFISPHELAAPPSPTSLAISTYPITTIPTTRNLFLLTQL